MSKKITLLLKEQREYYEEQLKQQKQEIIEEIEKFKQDENMEGVSTATEVMMKERNHKCNQVLEEITNKIKEI